MEVVNVEEPICAVRISQYPEDKKNEFLILGRSNVGKSSFINTIINRKNYARTSSAPGKTQTLNFYKINDEFYLVDAPGYGFAKVRNSLKKKFGLIMESYLKALDKGDKNVYYIDGDSLFAGYEYDSCTVDGCHPNDLGFYCMAQGILPVLKEILYWR